MSLKYIFSKWAFFFFLCSNWAAAARLWLGNLVHVSMTQQNDDVLDKVKWLSNKSIIWRNRNEVSFGYVSIYYSWVGERKWTRLTKERTNEYKHHRLSFSSYLCLWGDFTLGSFSDIHQYIDWNNALKPQRNLFPFLLPLDSLWKIEAVLFLIQGKLHWH